MLRVALIDIDTTHPWAIANYVNATGRARVVGVADHGATWPRTHVAEFARRLGGDAKVYDDAVALLEVADAALFCGTRYDHRLNLALHWLEAGKTVFLDKPAVGTVREVRILEEYVQRGARILCGSSLPWCTEIRDVWRHASRGMPTALVVVGWRSLFEYGLHGTDIALNLLQSRPRLVRWGAFGPTECVWAELENGNEVAVHVGLEGGPWQVSCLTPDGVFATPLDIGLFRGCHVDLLARAFVELAETGRTEIPPSWHLEGIKLLIAAKKSRDEERAVSIDELKDDDGFNGEEYAAAYRAIAERSNPDAYMSPPLAELLKARGAAPRNGGRAIALGLGRRVARKVLGERGTRLVKQAMGRA